MVAQRIQRRPAVVRWLARPVAHDTGWAHGCIDVAGTGYMAEAYHVGDGSGFWLVVQLEPLKGGRRHTVTLGPDGDLCPDAPRLALAVRAAVDALEVYERRSEAFRAACEVLRDGCPFGSEGVRS